MIGGSYHLDFDRRTLMFFDRVRAIARQRNARRADLVLVEDAGSGTAVRCSRNSASPFARSVPGDAASVRRTWQDGRARPGPSFDQPVEGAQHRGCASGHRRVDGAVEIVREKVGGPYDAGAIAIVKHLDSAVVVRR